MRAAAAVAFAALLLAAPCSSSASADGWVSRGDSLYLLVKGATGRSFEEARADCRQRHSAADLLWLETQQEAGWLTDRLARSWRLRDDWRQCPDCPLLPGAWIGLARTAGRFSWTRNSGGLSFQLPWMQQQPQPAPMDAALVFDSGRWLQLRTELRGTRLWHFCKRPRSSSSSKSISSSSSNCPAGAWVLHEGNCYRLVKKMLAQTFAQARAECRSSDPNADLLWLETQEEWRWLTDRAARAWRIREDWRNCTNCPVFPSAWVGLYRASDSAMRWAVSGAPVDIYLNWMPAHPRPAPSNYAALYDSGRQLQFRSDPGSLHRWYFCKTRNTTSTHPPMTTVPPPTTAPILCPTAEWTLHDGNCYLLVKGVLGRTFDRALVDCHSRAPGANLLWLETGLEQHWLADRLSRRWRLRDDWGQCTDCTTFATAWIGLYRDTDQLFKWAVDGSRVDFDLYWWFSQPRRSPADFGVLFDSGQQLRLRTELPNTKRWHICKVRAADPPTPPPTTLVTTQVTTLVTTRVTTP